MSTAVTYGDCELFYLKCAYDTFPREKPDIETCRLLAETLEGRERYVEAINFWHKVEQVRPDDVLPKRAIATLTVKLHDAKDGKFEGERRTISSSFGGAKPDEITHEERLKRRLQRNPQDLACYDELAGVYLNDERYDKAIEVLQQKLAVTNNDINVQEAIEDVQLKTLRSKYIAADAQAKKTGKEADAKVCQEIRHELIEKELQTYRNRCERYPNNLEFRFQLGRLLLLAERIDDAIKELQVAKADPRKRGVCMLYLGDCFYAIKQYPLAMTHYEAAIQDIPDRDQDNKKKALLKAGKLALGLKDLAKADKYLTTLASMDFTYPKIAEMLEHLKAAKDAESGTSSSQEKPKRKDEEEEEVNEEEEQEEE